MKDSKINTLLEAVNESYHVASLGESEYKLYCLICRYENKVSKRLLEKKKELREKGRKEFVKISSALMFKSNHLMEIVKNKSTFDETFPLSVIGESKE